MISSRPSRARDTSSEDACAIRRPMRSTANVRMWLTLTHERFGKPRAWTQR